MIAGSIAGRPQIQPASFESLLLPLLPSAYGTALRLTRSPTDAEDLVQEAALQAFRGFASFRPGSNFKAWFFRILTNCFISRYRATRRERGNVPLEDAPPQYLYARTAEAGWHTGRDPAETLLRQMTEEQVGRAVDALPDDYRAVATLYFIEDFSYQQIAEMLGIPVGTVRSRLHRGRRLLQRALWRIALEHGIVRPTGEA